MPLGEMGALLQHLCGRGAESHSLCLMTALGPWGPPGQGTGEKDANDISPISLSESTVASSHADHHAQSTCSAANGSVHAAAHSAALCHAHPLLRGSLHGRCLSACAVTFPELRATQRSRYS